MRNTSNRQVSDMVWEEPLPNSCSKTCQCSDLPTKCSEHTGLCSVDIARVRNHTHVVVLKDDGDFENSNLSKSVRLCVSPKCIAPQETESFQRVPERDCLQCYDRSLKVEQPAAEESKILLYSWRVNHPAQFSWNLRSIRLGGGI